jgi:predicted RNA-binding Zn ribbon-like protein
MTTMEETASLRFDLSGGALGLDFANTWSDRGRPETDGLHRYADLLAFGRQTGTATEDEAARLAARAEREPLAATAAFARALDLRESLYRLFSAAADSLPPAAGDVALVNAALPEALARLRLTPRGGGFSWAWEAPGSPEPPLDAPLWPILRSTAELLTADELQRVRECAAGSCTWLFLDRSRNRSRRWCSMETCGNRAKAHRHYQRRSGTERPED